MNKVNSYGRIPRHLTFCFSFIFYLFSNTFYGVHARMLPLLPRHPASTGGEFTHSFIHPIACSDFKQFIQRRKKHCDSESLKSDSLLCASIRPICYVFIALFGFLLIQRIQEHGSRQNASLTCFHCTDVVAHTRMLQSVANKLKHK